ncbi:MAG TPA: hypothetical protein VHP11_15525 [Tepidisphaeraceae bacterium]|nr:hypothetical protein [Tepidisphaeraceae bacterium]
MVRGIGWAVLRRLPVGVRCWVSFDEIEAAGLEGAWYAVRDVGESEG